MTKKIFSLTLGALLLALCFPAKAQQANKVPRIGDLSPGDAASESTRSEAIRLALWELGYVEGQNIGSWEVRGADSFKEVFGRAKPGVSEWTLCNRRPANSFQRKTNRGLCDQR